MPCRKYPYQKISTLWLSGDWAALSGHKLKLKLLEKMASSEEGQEKFWSRVEKGKSKQCWNWAGHIHKPSGYGLFSFQCGPTKRLVLRVHRIAYFLKHGLLPDELDVCHSCDNTRCVNPKHLWLGTPRLNTFDRDQKERQARGESHGKAKLKEREVREIRKLRTRQKSRLELSEMFNVNIKTIDSVIYGYTWKHVK